MDANPDIEEVLNHFDEELRRRGVPNVGETLYYRKADVVIVALEEARNFLDKDGLTFFADTMLEETAKRGIPLNPLVGNYICNYSADFEVGHKDLTVILTRNAFHRKNQLIIGMHEETQPFADYINQTKKQFPLEILQALRHLLG